MTTYLVTYSDPDSPDCLGLTMQQYFVCVADDPDHAVEQMKDAYPEADLLAVDECVRRLG